MNVMCRRWTVVVWLLGGLTVLWSIGAEAKSPRTTEMKLKNEFWQKEFQLAPARFEEQTASFFSSFPAMSTNEHPDGVFYRVIVDGQRMMYMDYRVVPAKREGWTIVHLRFPQISKKNEHRNAAQIVYKEILERLEENTAETTIPTVAAGVHPGIEKFQKALGVYKQDRFGTAAKLFSRFIDDYKNESELKSELVRAAIMASDSYRHEKRRKKYEQMCEQAVQFVQKFQFSNDSEEAKLTAECNPAVQPKTVQTSGTADAIETSFIEAEGRGNVVLIGGIPSDVGIVPQDGVYVVIEGTDFHIPDEVAQSAGIVQMNGTENSEKEAEKEYRLNRVVCKKVIVLAVATEQNAACMQVEKIYLVDELTNETLKQLDADIQKYRIRQPIVGYNAFVQGEASCKEYRTAAITCKGGGGRLSGYQMAVQAALPAAEPAENISPKTLAELDRETSQRSNGTLPDMEQVQLESQYRLLFLNESISRFTLPEFKFDTSDKMCAATLYDGAKLKTVLPGDCIAKGEQGELLPTSNGSLWRIEGTSANLNGYTFVGEETDPLRFIVLKEKGLVYLFGKGHVISQDGKKIILHNTTPFGVVTEATSVKQPMAEKPAKPTCNEGESIQTTKDGTEECVAPETSVAAAAVPVGVQEEETEGKQKRKRHPLKVTGAVTFVVGLAATGAGVGLGIGALVRNQRLEDDCSVVPNCEVVFADDIEARDNMAQAATGLLVGGGSLAAVGLTLYIIGRVIEKRNTPAAASELHLSPVFQKNAAGLLLERTF